MSTTVGPPGWLPHEIGHRLDGWIVDADDPDRIPAGVAEVTARALPPLTGHDAIANIRARMQARQAMHERMQNVFGDD